MNKIMVVDDEPNIRELIRLILKKEGFEVLEANDGVDALAKLDTNKVDLVVLDIMMPNMAGWEFCRVVRDFCDIPILMLTAKGEISQKVKGFELGVADYLTKPFEPEELIARVKALLNISRKGAARFEEGTEKALLKNIKLKSIEDVEIMSIFSAFLL